MSIIVRSGDVDQLRAQLHTRERHLAEVIDEVRYAQEERDKALEVVRHLEALLCAAVERPAPQLSSPDGALESPLRALLREPELSDHTKQLIAAAAERNERGAEIAQDALLAATPPKSPQTAADDRMAQLAEKMERLRAGGASSPAANSGAESSADTAAQGWRARYETAARALAEEQRRRREAEARLLTSEVQVARLQQQLAAAADAEANKVGALREELQAVRAAAAEQRAELEQQITTLHSALQARDEGAAAAHVAERLRQMERLAEELRGNLRAMEERQAAADGQQRSREQRQATEHDLELSRMRKEREECQDLIEKLVQVVSTAPLAITARREGSSSSGREHQGDNAAADVDGSKPNSNARAMSPLDLL